MGKLVYVTDVEGPIINPKVDFAWVTLEELIPKDMKSKYLERVKLFDEYDDLRWIEERPVAGHSTGTTPVISALISILARLTNEDLLESAKKYAIETPGASHLINYLKVREVPIYFITSSAPFVPLIEAYKRDIPSTNIYTMGRQPPENLKKNLDCFRKHRTDGRTTGELMLSEVYLRFPFNSLINRGPGQQFLRKLLTKFLDKYLNICEDMRIEYLKPQPEEKVLKKLKRRQLNLLGSVRNKFTQLGNILDYLLYDEQGIMGAHRKRQALEEIQKKEGVEKKDLVFVGDGIVDADPLKYADIGISVNCTNEEALLSSDINMAIPDMKPLTLVINTIRQCETADKLTPKLKSLKRFVDTHETRGHMFLKEDIEADLESVKSVNREFKNLIKRL